MSKYINYSALIYVPGCENQANYTIKGALKLDETRDVEGQARDHANARIKGARDYILKIDYSVV